MISLFDTIYGIVPPLLISLAFVTPFLGLFIKNKKFFTIYIIVITMITLVMTCLVAYNIFSRNTVAIYPFGGWPPPIGIAYTIDKLNASLALLATLIILLSAISTKSYLSRYKKSSTLSYMYTALIGFTAGAIGALYTGDIFNLFVMMEVMCISLYVLIAFHRTRSEAIEASIKYSLVSIIALIIYFFSTILIYSGYQTLNMADLATKARPIILDILKMYSIDMLSSSYYSDIYIITPIAIALIIWVFTLESALFPNHFWLPDAISEAPTPVSAILPIAEMVSIYVVIRYLFTIFGPDSILAENNVRNIVLYILLILGIIASIVGSIMMTLQKDSKRLLGYSSVSHIGFIYIAIGLTAFTSEPTIPLVASIFHMINYVISSSLLFLAIGAIESVIGSRNIDDMAGLGRSAKLAGFSIVIGVLNLIGLPPLGGFFSKFMIYQAALTVSQPIIALLIVVATAISVMGYAKLLLIPFGINSEKNIKESYSFSVPSFILALMIILLGLMLPIGLNKYLEDIAKSAHEYVYYVESFLKYMVTLWPR
ncbi:MAG: proton-conducting transporter membrane subunit [Ignisphaera sp.]|uniref:NADH:quinone oxidoreductase/Mrp antiporter transmembrane domain-containing protein n=1 Tax=Ignisphaera aggregans TaxID=334771 RepID=A0A7J3MZ56_9CREN